MITDTQKILSWDKSDTTFADFLSLFFDSTDNVWFSNFVAMKKRVTDLTVDTTFIDIDPIKNIGQFCQKQNDLNIFAETASNRWVDYDIENKLFILKNQQSYSPDIFNKFENFLTDNSSGSILKFDISNFVNAMNTQPDLSGVMPHTTGCDVKYVFNVRSIAPLHKKNLTNAQTIAYYLKGSVQPYFYNVNQVLKSSMVFNRYLYDHFFTNKRSSYIMIDFTNGGENVSCYFYKMSWVGSAINLTLYKYDTMWAFMHYKQNQIVNTDWTFANNNRTSFDLRQHGYTMDNESSDYIGSMSKISPTNYGHNPTQIVYESIPNKWVCVGGSVLDTSFDISSITNLDVGQIKRVEIAPSKQHAEIDSTNWTSLYTLRVVTTDDKQLSIPFSLLLQIDSSYTFTAASVIPAANCTFFDQNELNSEWDGSAWVIEQDTFVITDFLAAQSFDSTTGILTLDQTSIKVVDNDHVFKITSSDKIRKMGNEFLNRYALINRNNQGIQDPQNWSRFTVMQDFSDTMYGGGWLGDYPMIVTPFGKWENRMLYSSMWANQYGGPSGNNYLLGSFGHAVRYEMYPTSTSQLYVFNPMQSFVNNQSNTTVQTKNYKATTWTYGIYGFYNSLINKIYFMETWWSSPNRKQRLTTWDLGPNTQKTLNDVTNDGTYYVATKWAKYKIDATSFEVHTLQLENTQQRYTCGLFRDQYRFDLSVSNFPTSKQMWYGWWHEYVSHDRGGVRTGYPKFINDNTVQISDEVGNIFENKYTFVNRTTTAWETTKNTKDSCKFIRYNRLILPPGSHRYNWNNNSGVWCSDGLFPFFRYDATTSWGIKARFGLTNGTTNNMHTAYWKVTPDGVKIYLVQPMPTQQLNFHPSIKFFVDSSMWIDATIGAVGYGFTRLAFNDADSTVRADNTLHYLPIGADVANRRVILDNEYDYRYYAYDVDTQTITSWFDPQTTPVLTYYYSIWAYCYSGGYHWIGAPDDDYTQSIFQCSTGADGTTMTIVKKWHLIGTPPAVAPAIMEYKDSTWNILTYATTYSIVPIDDSNAVIYSSATLTIDETTDTEYKKIRWNGFRWLAFFGDTPCLMWSNAPFVVNGYNSDTSAIMYSKRWNASYTDYVLTSPPASSIDTTQTNQNYVARRSMHQLMSEDKAYFIWNVAATSVNMHLAKKVKSGVFPPYTPKANHIFFDMSAYTIDQTQTAVSAGWNVDGVINFISREGVDSITQGQASSYMRQIEHRVWDAVIDYQKIYRYYWYERFISTQTTGASNPFAWRSANNPNVIEFMTNQGQLHSWNMLTNQFDKVNMWRASVSSFSIGDPSMLYYSGMMSKDYVWANRRVFNRKRNRWFSMPNIKSTTSGAAVCTTGNYLFYLTGLWGATCDSFMLNKLTCFNPQPLLAYNYTPNRYYVDDQSNMIFTNILDSHIVDHPKFYNNICGCDICPSTFDEYASALHTAVDDRWWILGVGMQWFRDKYDRINIHKTPYSTNATETTLLRNAHINNEISWNFRVLRYQRHNANVSGYSFNNGNNGINSNVFTTLVTDFTSVDFTKVDASTLFVGGLVKYDWSSDLAYECWDYGHTLDNTAGIMLVSTTGSDSTVLRVTQWHAVTCRCQTPFSGTVDFGNIAVKTVSEFNDFYIKLDVTDSTNQSTSLYLNNPKGTFAEFPDNKVHWLAHTSYFKHDTTVDATGANVTDVDAWIIFPHSGNIVKKVFKYNDFTDTTNSKLYKYDYHFFQSGDVSTFTVTGNFWYSVPLLLVDNTIMWFASDVSNRLFSVSLATGTIINEYSNVKVRYKQNYDGRLMKIVYDYAIPTGSIRKMGILAGDGTLTELGSIDVLTESIISGKNNTISDITVSGSGSYIAVSKSDVSVSNIYLGDKRVYVSTNWYYDSSYLTWVSMNIRSHHSHTTDEFILILNKTDQKWTIEGTRFDETVWDGTDAMTLNNIMNSMLVKSNDIIQVKDSPNYPLYSKLIAYYDTDSRSIKYFDYLDGLIYKLQDVVVYDGAFFYRNMPYKLPYKEFAIWDKFLSSMQYHDALPNVYFFPWRVADGTNTIGTPVDYIYDNTCVYLLVNFGSNVDKVKLSMDVGAIVDYNSDLATYANNFMSSDATIWQKVVDFTGVLPCGLLAFQRVNVNKEAIAANRYVKVVIDYTFQDWTNKFGNVDFVTSDCVSDNTMCSPFNTFTVWFQKFKSLSDIKTGNNTWYDFTGKHLYGTNNNLLHLFNSISPYPSPTHVEIKDGTGSVEFYVDPLDVNQNAFLLCWTALSSLKGQQISSSSTSYPSYYKWYYATKLCGSIKVAYDPNVYQFSDAWTGYHWYVNDNWDSFKYDFMDVTLNSWDWFQIDFKPAMPDYCNLNYMLAIPSDNAKWYKNINQEWIGYLRDTTDLPAQALDVSATVSSYTGNVAQGIWKSGIRFSDRTTGPYNGKFTFDRDITGYGLYMFLSDLGGQRFNVDFTYKLWDATGVKIFDSSSTVQAGYQTARFHQDFNSGAVCVFRTIEIIMNRAIGVNQQGYMFGLGVYTNPWGDAYTGTQTYLYISQYGSTSPQRFYWTPGTDFLSNSALEMQQAWNQYSDTTATIIAKREGLKSNQLNLKMLGYDGTYSTIRSGSNSWQKHTVVLDSSAVGFIVKVKPETENSVPIIEVRTDSTLDEFGGADDRFVAGYIKGKKQ